MSNILYIPRANPIKFQEVTPAQAANNLTKFYDDYAYRYSLHDWEEKPPYCQKVMRSDITHLQFISNYTPIQLDITNADGQSLQTIMAVQKLQSRYNPGFYAFEAVINWSAYPVGVYFITILAGGVIQMVSEPINLAEIWENTLNFGYYNSRFHADVIFETGIKFFFRVEGTIGRILPGSTDQVYEDQKLNPYLLSSRPFNAFRLSMGGSFGIPDWVIEKLNIIWSCNNVFIDGRSFAKSGEAKFSYNEEEDYPMRGVEMEIREGINRQSKIVTGDFDINKKVVVQQVLDSRLFGALGNGNNPVVLGFE